MTTIAFPRVLIVTKTRIGDVDSASGALRGWFKDWPRESLSQVFSGVPAGGTAFCERSFQLGPDERRFGRTFFRLKSSSFGDAALPYRTSVIAAGTPPRNDGALTRAARAVGRELVDSGLWELIFAPRLSSRLRAFIEEFRPEALFVQGCDISFMRLPMMIRAAFGTPIHFDVVDDWVVHLYRGSRAGPLMNRVVQRTFRDLLVASACRYTIGEAMAETYRGRYGLEFTTLMQCDDQERFDRARSVPGGERDVFEIVYSGSLALGRWRALTELAEVCASLGASGRKLCITAYAPFVPSEAEAPLRASSCLTVRPAVPDAEVPRILARADLLFLPESFDPKVSEYTRLSVSTKAHLYMMSGRPSLVYGPEGIGTVEYARRHGWAQVVDRAGPAPLAEALDLLLRDPRAREQLVENARRVAGKFHAGPVVRDSLRRSLVATSS